MAEIVSLTPHLIERDRIFAVVTARTASDLSCALNGADERKTLIEMLQRYPLTYRRALNSAERDFPKTRRENLGRAR